jgi:hypothetical protein
MSEFKTVNGLVLVKPLKLKYKTIVEKVVDREASKGLDPVKDEMIMKDESKKIYLTQQLGEVIDIGTLDAEKVGFNIGDIIVYNYKMASEFELQKGLVITNSFNIIAKKIT